MIFCSFSLSLSVWREWIEMLNTSFCAAALKSLSVWREWIEIGNEGIAVAAALSLSVWREWIEMTGKHPESIIKGLSLYGESGLKSKKTKRL